MALLCTVSTCRPWPSIFACLEPARRNFAIWRWRCMKVESDITPNLILFMWMWAAFDVGSISAHSFSGSIRGIRVAFREHSLQRCVVPINIFEEVDFALVVHDSGAIKYQNRNGFNEVDLGVVLARLHS